MGNKYNCLVDLIKEEYNVEVKYKEKNWFWKRLPSFLRNSGITFPKTIWMPFDNNNFNVLAHEYVHLVDIKKLGIFKFFLYYLDYRYRQRGLD